MRNHTAFMQMMLGVAMTHYPGNLSLPIPRATLGDMGMECHAYAKALRCREQDLYSHCDKYAINLGVPAPRAKMTPELLVAVEDMIRIYQACAHGPRPREQG